MQANQQVWVKVVNIFPDMKNPQQMKIKLSMGLVDQGSGEDLDPEHLQSGEAASRAHATGPQSSDPLNVFFASRYSSGIQTFGAFIKIPGYRNNGLVHITQIVEGRRVEAVSEG